VTRCTSLGCVTRCTSLGLWDLLHIPGAVWPAAHPWAV